MIYENSRLDQSRIVSCSGKLGHSKKADADKEIKRKKQQGKSGFSKNFSSYRCIHCGNWHVGNHKTSKEIIKSAKKRTAALKSKLKKIERRMARED
jgi:hypothetical protein